MKKIILCVLASVFFLSCENENKINSSDVPQATMAAFNAKYPGASGTEWVTEKKKDKMIYEAKFKFNDKKIEAEFDDAGNFLEEE